jgi:hypothetical protein
MHTAKKQKRKLRKKVPLRYSSPISNNTSTTKTTPELQALQKATPPRRKQCTSAVVARSKIIGFHLEDSPRSQNNAFNKGIARHNQLRPDLGFSP